MIAGGDHQMLAGDFARGGRDFPFTAAKLLEPERLGVPVNAGTFITRPLRERLRHIGGRDVPILRMVEAAENAIAVFDQRPQAANFLRVEDVRLHPLGRGGAGVPAIFIETIRIGGKAQRAAVVKADGLAGSFYALENRYINPDDGLPVETFIVWAMVILGGRGSATGVMVGTIVVQTLYVGTRYLTTIVPISADMLSALRLVAIGVLIVLIMMFRPQGLVPERRRVYGAAPRR